MGTLIHSAGCAIYSVAVCYELPAGESPDLQDVTAQADFLRKHLCAAHRMDFIQFDGDITDFISRLKNIDVVWNLFESFKGKEEDQHLGAAAIELAGVPYTGSRLDALVLCSDKRITKAVFAGEGVQVPRLYKGIAAENSQWIVKPAKLHGSVGISDSSVMDGAMVRDAVAADSSLIAKPAELIIEDYIDGEEYSASLLDMGKGLKTIAVAKMQFVNYPEGRPHILGYDSKWDENSADYTHTVRTFTVDKVLVSKIAQIAERCGRILGLGGFARIDFRMDRAGKLYVIDVNPNPGLGEDSGFIAACVHAGISIEDSLNYIINAALR